jgi:hypothetical protein
LIGHLVRDGKKQAIAELETGDRHRSIVEKTP